MRFERAGSSQDEDEFIDQVKQKLAIPGNDPVNVTERRLEHCAAKSSLS